MEIRTYQPKDEIGIQALFEKVFQTERSLEHWKWKYSYEFNKTKPLILVAVDNNKIVGHVSLWVQRAYVNGVEAKIALRVDTMVDPDYRGKGLYKLLNDKMIEHAHANHLQFLYGFPAPKAKELFQKYTNADHLTNMPRWVNILRPMNIASSKMAFLQLFSFVDHIFAKLKLRRLKDEDKNIKRVTQCGEEFDKLANKTKEDYHIQLIRDAAYLNWRYFSHPENNYHMYGYYEAGQLLGYIVYKITEQNKLKTGMIMDIVCEKSDKEQKVYKRLVHTALFHMRHVDMIQTWALPHQAYVPLLKKVGFIHKDSPMPLVTNKIIHQDNQSTSFEDWLITLGDVDSF